MGQAHTKLPEDQLKELQGRTLFSPQDLQKWYDIFSKGRHTGVITKEDFVFENLGYTRFGDEQFWASIFDILDSDKSGTITFQEWIIALSILSTQALDAKTEWIFNTIDRDGNGTISKSELETFLKFVGKLSNNSVNYSADDILNALDKDHSGIITLKDFSDGVLNNKDIIKCLDLSALLKQALSHVGTVEGASIKS